MDMTRASKKLSYLLRHDKDFIDEHGWAPVTAVIHTLKEEWPEFDEECLSEIVRTDAMGRYFYDEAGVRIRANQGHSVPVDVELKEAEPPEILYHGTADRFLNAIMEEGLTGRSRIYVHLSSTMETAVNVGKRHGKPVVLKIYAGRMRDAGHKFYLSQNQVWLTPKVPVEYIEPLNPEQGAESAEGGV